jgi:hypothetical protein
MRADGGRARLARAASRSALGIASQLRRCKQAPLRVVGRERELASLREHIRARRSVLLSGPAGFGKTAVLQALYAEWDASRDGVAILYGAESRTPRSLITHLLINLFLDRGRLESQHIQRRRSVASLDELRRFVAHERLPELMRMVHQNLERDRVSLGLDHLDDPHPKVTSMIEAWLETTPLILVARRAEALGRAQWLFPSCARVELAPLDETTLRGIARHFVGGMSSCHLDDVDLDQAARLAAGSPRRLQELLRAAARRDYQERGVVQWRLIELDLRIRAIGLGERPRRPPASRPSCARERRCSCDSWMTRPPHVRLWLSGNGAGGAGGGAPRSLRAVSSAASSRAPNRGCCGGFSSASGMYGSRAPRATAPEDACDRGD